MDSNDIESGILRSAAPGTPLRGLAAACLIGAVICGLAGCVPRSWVIPIGPMIGRPNAVTPEVHLRLLLVCRVFSAASMALGGFAWYRPAVLRRPWRAWAEERGRWRISDDRGWWVVLAIMGVAAALRGVHLQTGMAYDESYTFLNYARKSVVEGIADYDSTNNHLLNTFVMHGLYRLGGAREAVLRLGVFAAGVLLIPVVYAWAKTWTDRTASLLTAVLVAIAPVLITYSFDARGYMDVALAAVCLDLACRRLRLGTEFPQHWVAGGMAAAVLGLWAMPIMLYAVISSCSVAVLQRWRDEKSLLRCAWTEWCGRMAIVGLLTFVLYSPAFIFRGLRFLNDPIMRPVVSGNYPLAAWTSWEMAWEWWTAGVIPPLAWGLFVVAGLVAWWFEREFPWPWFCPFLTVVAINLLKQAAPPPRISLFLLPWIALAAGHGCVSLCRRGRIPAAVPGMIAAVLLMCGAAHAVRSPVLIFPEERALFADVPFVVAALLEDVSRHPEDRARLLSPLPVDYPSRFYLERARSDVPMNGVPQSGETLYLIVPTGSTPRDVLRRPPIELDDSRLDHADWEPVSILEGVSQVRSLQLFQTRLVPEVD